MFIDKKVPPVYTWYVQYLDYSWGSVLILLGYSFKETGDRNNSLFLEGGSTMVLELVECPVCGGTNVIKHGKSGEGKQRYLCQDPECHGKTFIRDYSDLGRLPQVKEQIIEMSLNGSGIRDIARVLKISPTTVIEEIKKRNRAERCKYRFAAPT